MHTNPRTCLALSALFAILAALCASVLFTGCAVTHSKAFKGISRVAQMAEPQSVTVGMTGPNFFNGPIYNTPKGQERPAESRFGVWGVAVSATYQLRKLQVERADVPPVRVLPAIPIASPSPSATPSADVH